MTGKADVKTDKGLYKSKIKASRKYDKDVEHIRLRVPKGWKEQIKLYIADSGKYNSVNSMICDLIKKEVGIDDK